MLLQLLLLFRSYSPKKVCLCMSAYRKIIRLKQSELFLPTCSWVFLSLGLYIFVVLLVAPLHDFLAPQMQDCHLKGFCACF